MRRGAAVQDRWFWSAAGSPPLSPAGFARRGASLPSWLRASLPDRTTAASGLPQSGSELPHSRFPPYWTEPITMAGWGAASRVRR